MALIAPEGRLTVEHPVADGMATELGLSRDWRPSPEWQGRNVEYIEPLGAIAPIGMTYPRDMRLVQGGTTKGWKVDWNTRFDEVRVSGAKSPYWIRFYDGKVHTPSTPDDLRVYTGKLDSTDPLDPNWVLSMVRYAPPAEQGVNAFVAVGMAAECRGADGVWQDGRVTVMFPLHWEEYPEPFLHVIYPVPDSYNASVMGEVVSRGPTASSRQQGAGRETWVCEYVDDHDHFSGGHILIRNWPSSERYWHYHHPDVRLVKGIQALTCAGHIVKVNLVPMVYGAGSVEYQDTDEHVPRTGPLAAVAHRSDAWPHQGWPLPHCEDSPFNVGASWTLQTSFGVASCPATGWGDRVVLTAGGWNVGVGKDNPPAGGDPDDPTGPGGKLGSKYRPYVYFDRVDATARGTRPVAWLAGEQHDAVIGDHQQGTGVSTQGDGVLQTMTYTERSDWRGGNGSAAFAIQDAELYSGWKEGGKVTVRMGWQAGAGYPFEAQDVAVAYIVPGGIERGRRGSEQSGLAHLGVEYGDFSVACMAFTEVVDLRQGGGMTVGEWAAMVANRLEIDPSMQETIAADVASRPIPMADPVPSGPMHEARDGGSWQGHLDAVCNSLDLRWGFNRAGKWFIDEGPPGYDPATPDIAYTLDHDAGDPEDAIYEFDVAVTNEKFRNSYKASSEGHTHYWIEGKPARLAGVGRARWKFVEGDDLGEPAALLHLLSREWYKYERLITWQGPLRPGLQPDHFVKVDHVPNCRLAAGTVFQIIEHRMTATKATLNGTSDCVAVVVYVP